jgi:hypothetical protein
MDLTSEPAAAQHAEPAAVAAAAARQPASRLPPPVLQLSSVLLCAAMFLEPLLSRTPSSDANTRGILQTWRQVLLLRSPGASDEAKAEAREAISRRLADCPAPCLLLNEDPAFAGIPRLVGCCNPGCVELSGDSELGLSLPKACRRCGQERYCSPACQWAAWNAGHKEACTGGAGQGA